MLPLRFAPLLLCLVLPFQGFAQASDSERGPPPTVTPPPLVPAPAEPQTPPDSPQSGPAETDEGGDESEPQGEFVPRQWRAERGSSLTTPRFLFEFLGGAVGGAVGLIPGGIISLSALCLESCNENRDHQFYGGLALAFVGVSTGAALGIVGGASLFGGEGGYWPTVAGAALGTLGGFFVGLALVSTINEGALIILALGPIFGGMIGYEMSQASAVSARRGLFASGARVVPVLTVSPRGGFLGGLAGSF